MGSLACRMPPTDAGWSSLVARRAHNPKVVGSNPAPATNSHRSFHNAAKHEPLKNNILIRISRCRMISFVF